MPTNTKANARRRIKSRINLINYGWKEDNITITKEQRLEKCQDRNGKQIITKYSKEHYEKLIYSETKLF